MLRFCHDYETTFIKEPRLEENCEGVILDLNLDSDETLVEIFDRLISSDNTSIQEVEFELSNLEFKVIGSKNSIAWTPKPSDIIFPTDPTMFRAIYGDRSPHDGGALLTYVVKPKLKEGKFFLHI